MQTRVSSFLESIANGFIGYFVIVLLQYYLLGIHYSLDKHLGIGVLYILVAIVRSYIIRRIFNSK